MPAGQPDDATAQHNHHHLLARFHHASSKDSNILHALKTIHPLHIKLTDRLIPSTAKSYSCFIKNEKLLDDLNNRYAVYGLHWSKIEIKPILHLNSAQRIYIYIYTYVCPCFLLGGILFDSLYMNVMRISEQGRAYIKFSCIGRAC
jgi:hypothetical protein